MVYTRGAIIFVVHEFMHLKHILLLFYTLAIAFISVVVVLSIFGVIPYLDIPGYVKTAVLGETSKALISPEGSDTVISPEVSSDVSVSLTTSNTPRNTLSNLLPVVPLSTPTTEPSVIRIVNASRELAEGEFATFTWQIAGPRRTIRTATVYFGRTSVPGPLGHSSAPTSTPYTDWLIEFMDGAYDVPLTFTASKKLTSPGTYYARAYAFINENHIWGDEQNITVKQIPKHEIRIVNRPERLDLGKVATFTWEVTGPSATTGFTVIAGGRESRPGPLDTSVVLIQTPYGILVNDFTGKNIDVPLRFVGNSIINETGTYYFRALVFLNDKKINIWSDEYSFTVQ